MTIHTPAAQAAMQEGERIAAAHDYFEARRKIDSAEARRIFEAGFDRAYALLSKPRAPVADERAAFEIHQRGTGLNKLYLERHAVSGQYMWTATKEAWDTWQARAALASAPTAEPFDAEVLAERLRDVAANHFEAALGFGIKQNHFERCAREAAKVAQAITSAPVAGEAQPVTWANWKVGTKSYVPYRTREEAQVCVNRSAIAATQEGPYQVVALAPAAPQASEAVNAAMADEYRCWIDYYHQGRDYDGFLKECVHDRAALSAQPGAQKENAHEA